MGKNKLQKFAEMEALPNVFQYPYAVLQTLGDCPLKGRWHAEVFRNKQPIVLELGCGRGEYTVRLGRLFPEKNFIGIDIKGARMWAGAKEAFGAKMTNVAFLRTEIERISHFFTPGEVAELWLTFPDPQMKKVNKRLTSTRFMRMYSEILRADGLIHLKTDSHFMFTYTNEMIKINHLPVQACTDDLYHSDAADDILSIRTYYEQQWLERGLNIKYLRFVCQPRETWIEPDIDIEPDAYRSYNRSRRAGSQTYK